MHPTARLTPILLLVLLPMAATAAPATVRQSVNLRAGPGMTHPVVGAVAEGTAVEAGPCTSKEWCEVTAGKLRGWAYGSFLTLPPGHPAPKGASPSGTTPTDPEAYVRANPAPDVILDGDLVIGAGVPQGIAILRVPGSKTGYLTINGRAVLVDQDRRITRILD